MQEWSGWACRGSAPLKSQLPSSKCNRDALLSPSYKSPSSSPCISSLNVCLSGGLLFITYKRNGGISFIFKLKLKHLCLFCKCKTRTLALQTYMLINTQTCALARRQTDTHTHTTENILEWDLNVGKCRSPQVFNLAWHTWYCDMYLLPFILTIVGVCERAWEKCIHVHYLEAM